MKKKVLVVDDEDDILQFLGLVLRERGYDVLTASAGREALAVAQRERPDFVLLDVMMPQMDGWEVLRRLKADPRTAEIPVAIVSARTGAKDRAEGLRAGAADYICKPFSLDELLGKLAAVLGGEPEPGDATP